MPHVIMWVMVVNNWAAGAADTDTTRMNIVARFFNTLMLENAASVLKKKAPTDYRCAGEIYTRAPVSHTECNETDESNSEGSTLGQAGETTHLPVSMLLNLQRILPNQGAASE